MQLARKNSKNMTLLLQAYMLVKHDRIITKIKEEADFHKNFGENKSISRFQYDAIIKKVMKIVDNELTGIGVEENEQ